MKGHVRYSYNRVCNFSGLSDNVLSAILQHHERMDGSGYLQKLRGGANTSLGPPLSNS
jgi:HD-GYP domain-containing protein (c-di-GMP phosphodiesterase class II)